VDPNQRDAQEADNLKKSKKKGKKKDLGSYC